MSGRSLPPIVIQGKFRNAERRLPGCGGDPRTVHDLLGELLRTLQTGCRSGGTECRDSLALERVDDPRSQGFLWADDHQVNLFGLSNLRDGANIIGCYSFHYCTQPGQTRVPRK